MCLSTTATPASPVAGSPYAITAGTGTLASVNYAFQFVNGQAHRQQGPPDRHGQ